MCHAERPSLPCQWQGGVAEGRAGPDRSVRGDSIPYLVVTTSEKGQSKNSYVTSLRVITERVEVARSPPERLNGFVGRAGNLKDMGNQATDYFTLPACCRRVRNDGFFSNFFPVTTSEKTQSISSNLTSLRGTKPARTPE